MLEDLWRCGLHSVRFGSRRTLQNRQRLPSVKEKIFGPNWAFCHFRKFLQNSICNWRSAIVQLILRYGQSSSRRESGQQVRHPIKFVSSLVGLSSRSFRLLYCYVILQSTLVFLHLHFSFFLSTFLFLSVLLHLFIRFCPLSLFPCICHPPSHHVFCKRKTENPNLAHKPKWCNVAVWPNIHTSDVSFKLLHTLHDGTRGSLKDLGKLKVKQETARANRGEMIVQYISPCPFTTLNTYNTFWELSSKCSLMHRSTETSRTIIRDIYCAWYPLVHLIVVTHNLKSSSRRHVCYFKTLKENASRRNFWSVYYLG